MTNDFFKRWRQHIGDLSGGARYTKQKKEWYPILIIDGFRTMREAMQCEWALKHNKKYKGAYRRIEYSHLLFHKKRWTSKSPKIKDQHLQVYIDDEYSHLFCNFPTKQLYWK
jgi:predicted GIY-YIG superfamily endonuclease